MSKRSKDEDTIWCAGCDAYIVKYKGAWVHDRECPAVGSYTGEAHMNLAKIRAMVLDTEHHDEGNCQYGTHWAGCETVHGWCAARVLLERLDRVVERFHATCCEPECKCHCDELRAALKETSCHTD